MTAKPARFELTWTNPFDGAEILISIVHKRDYAFRGTDHLEIVSENPERAPLPITRTGYLSHFINSLDLVNAGGPVTFVASWLERRAQTKEWRAAEAKRRQTDLFAWADARDEQVKRRSKKSEGAAKAPKRPKASKIDRPSRRPKQS